MNALLNDPQNGVRAERPGPRWFWARWLREPNGVRGVWLEQVKNSEPGPLTGEIDEELRPIGGYDAG